MDLLDSTPIKILRDGRPVAQYIYQTEWEASGSDVKEEKSANIKV